MTSVSPFSETPETAPDPHVSALLDLIERAKRASERMSRSNPNRKLLADLSVALVAHAQRVRMLEGQTAEKPRIVLP